ncbi:MAG: ABC transporter ATP-binding protein/permease [Treponema sp.]|jgi:ABC-type bacteriocin/lantibiotic exporter with double-glycine peptidase domain|nr:ABC transporter ATP-binding protein/permease [Treponema sp.]
MKMTNKYWKQQALVVFISLFAISLASIVPFLLKDIIQYIQDRDFSPIKPLFIVVIVVIFVRKTADFIFNYLFNNLYLLVSHDKRNEIFSHIMNSQLFRKQTIDSTLIINRLLNETYAYGDIIGIAPIMLIINCIMFIVSGIVLCNINIYLFIGCCFFIPFVFMTTILMKKKIESASVQHRNKYEHLLKTITEILNAFAEIKIMKAEQFILSRFVNSNKNYLDSEKRMNKVQRLSTDISDILFSILPVLCLLFGLYLITLGKSDIGGAVAFYLYLGFFIEPITNLTSLRVRLIQSKKKKTLVEEIANAFEKESVGHIHDIECNKISLNSIDYQYDANKVAFNLDINISAYGMYYVSGKSGVGKSTILKILTKILYSEKTQIMIDGVQLNNITEQSYFEKASYLNNSPQFFAGTIQENITFFGKYPADPEIIPLFFDEDEEIDLQSELSLERGSSLSSGQLQRLNILRLLVKGKRQKIIVLDEALSGIDESKERKIISYLKNYFNESFIFIVIHRKSTKELCDFHIDVDIEKVAFSSLH